MKKIDLLKDKNPFLNVKKRALLWKKYLGNIGNNCEIFGKVSFGSEPYLINIGNNVKITYGCKFITHDGGVYVLRNLNKLPNAHIYGGISIGNNVFLGNDVIILPGCTIGNNCIIGAGSIISKSIGDNTVAAGVPAKKICSIEEYYQKNRNNAVYTGDLSYIDKKDMLLKMFDEDEKKLLKK